MNFTGCGVITDWTIVGAGAGGGSNGNIDRVIELQLFRPDPTRSTVFTKVTSSVVTTSIRNIAVLTHTFTSIGFTFSHGDVLGFYYPNTGDWFEVHHTTSFSTHSVLTSINSPIASVATLRATTTGVPLMSVAGELSYLMLVHSVLYSHHCMIFAQKVAYNACHLHTLRTFVIIIISYYMSSQEIQCNMYSSIALSGDTLESNS